MSYTTLWAYTWDLTHNSTADNIAALRNDIGLDAGQVHAGFGAYHPAAPDEQTLVANTLAAAEEGISGFSYYNYGIMPKQNLG